MESIAEVLVRPPRTTYDPNKDLGPKLFLFQTQVFERIDYEWKNNRDLTIQASLYIPKRAHGKKYNCVIYCHGNCGNKTNAFECLEIILPLGLAVLVFDFSGSGLSGGNYVTYGFYEKDDIKCVVDNLLEINFILCVALWGRSMGAASALLYSSIYFKEKIAALCLDSPFKDLQSLCEEIMIGYKIPTNFLRGYLLEGLKQSAEKKAKFIVEDVSPISVVHKSEIPALFVHGLSDELININHSREIFEKYKGEKKLIEIEGGHNDKRPEKVYNEIKDFFLENFAKAEKELKQTAQREALIQLINNKIENIEKFAFHQPQPLIAKKPKASLNRNKSFDFLDKNIQKSRTIQETYGEFHKNMKTFETKMKKQFSFKKLKPKRTKNVIHFPEKEISNILDNITKCDIKSGSLSFFNTVKVSKNSQDQKETMKLIKKIKKEIHQFQKI